MSRPVAIVVPAHEEEHRLPRLFASLTDGGLEALAAAGLDATELIVVDDRSTDSTAALVRSWADRDPRIRLVQADRGAGKGAAVRAGVLAASAPWLLVMDADMATPLEEAAKLVAALEAGADVAIGSRGLTASEIVVHQPRRRELAGKTFNLMVRLLTRLPYRDTQCGFKLFRAEQALPLFEEQRVDGFAFDVEILLAARRHGLAVTEVAVRWLDDPQTRVRFIPASLGMTIDLLGITLRDRRRAFAATRPAIRSSMRQRGRAK